MSKSKIKEERMMNHRLILPLLILVLLSGCGSPFSKLKKEQFDILKANVTSILGDEYSVKQIKIETEGYTSDAKDEYVVDFKFDLNKPFAMFPSANLPGKLIFQKNEEGDFQCIFNSGNPSELFQLF